MEKLEINGEVYIKESSIDNSNYVASPIQIVVLNRGWVAVGNVSESGSKTIIRNASIIRAWGTSKGLGELAEKGEISGKTVLDKCPDIIVETCNIVLVMNCNQKNWK